MTGATRAGGMHTLSLDEARATELPNQAYRVALAMRDNGRHVPLPPVNVVPWRLHRSGYGYVLPRYAATAGTVQDATTLPAGQHLGAHAGLTLRPYQRDALAAWWRHKNGVIVAPCGAGKTAIGLSAVLHLDTPALVLDLRDTTADELSVAALLAAHAAETGTETAIARLFERWNLRYDSLQGAPCPQASAAGLECATVNGSWSQLLQLRRPAVLALADPAGNAHQVLLVQVNGEQARLALGTGNAGIAVRTGDLLQHWQGQALLLWRPAFQPVRSLSYGMRGPEVRSLAELLQQARGGHTRDPLGDQYDGELQLAVKAFQQRHRLVVDGIAGVRTQMVLDAVADTRDVPLLTSQEAR